jgi:hypothetical protein
LVFSSDLDNLSDFSDITYPEPLMKASLKVALEVTSEVMILETIHRFAVCFYEALCTHAGHYGVMGGGTPGKMLLGLKVVSCEWVAPTGQSLTLHSFVSETVRRFKPFAQLS